MRRTGFGKKSRHRVGSLRHFITVEKPVKQSTDDRGRPVINWETLIEGMPASISMLSGSEVETARQLVPEATVRIEFHADSRITSQMRFTYQGRIFYIGFIDPVALANRWMVCTCSEDLT